MQTVIIKEDNRLKLARTDIIEWKTNKNWITGRPYGYIYTLTVMTVNKNPVTITTTSSEETIRACEEEPA